MDVSMTTRRREGDQVSVHVADRAMEELTVLEVFKTVSVSVSMVFVSVCRTGV